MQTITNNDDKAVLPADVVSEWMFLSWPFSIPPFPSYIGLSYWLARRLPVDDTTKLELLKMNCPTMRIMQGLRMLNVSQNPCVNIRPYPKSFILYHSNSLTFTVRGARQ